ncbi:hypothetical protein KFE98_07050 [bacterium SCSIO 12741]|nr:hypothetical protein KFE98_07050 [bacterium SCSIO 12741]
MKVCLSSLIALTLSLGSIAQEVAIGQWRDHLPYRNIKLIAETADRVYASSESGLMAYDLNEQSVDRISTINGLSDIGITALGASPDGKVLFVGYETGGIDLVKGNQIVYRADAVRANILGNRQINDFMFHNDLCYIATGFGILEFDYKNGDIINAETRETFLIGDEGAYVFVNSTHVLNDTLYAATEEGLFLSPYNNELYVPSNWKKDTTIPNPDSNFDIVSSIGNELLVNYPVFEYRKDTLFSKINGKWSVNTHRLGEDNRSMKRYDDRIVFASTTSMEMYDSSWTVLRKAFTWGGGGLDPNICVLGQNEVVWIGDRRVGLIKNLNEQVNDVINLGGPASNRAFNVFVYGNRHFVTGGGHNTNGFTFKLSAELSFQENDDWTIYTGYNTSKFQGVQDVTSVTVNPKNKNIFFASSLNQGLIQFENDQATTHYPCDGDTLDTITGEYASLVM